MAVGQPLTRGERFAFNGDAVGPRVKGQPGLLILQAPKKKRD